MNFANKSKQIEHHYPKFDNEFLKKVTNQCYKTIPSKHLNDNTVIVYNDMDDTDTEVEENEV